MRRRVEANIPPAQAERELKLGRGGLRDVEFAVQLLQLVHGRADASLRVGGTLPALTALSAGGYVGRDDAATLIAAYRFLRTVEHRLQLLRLRRTHLLPDRPTQQLRWLARSLGYKPDDRGDAVDVLQAELALHAREVRRLHEKLFYRPLLRAVARVPGEQLAAAARRRRGDRLRGARLRRPRRRRCGTWRRSPAGCRRVGGDAAHLLPVLLQSSPTRRPGRRPARLPAGQRGAGQHPVVPAAAARRGPGRRAAGRGCSARSQYVADLLDPRPRGAAAAGRRRRARAAHGAEALAGRVAAGGRPARRPGRGASGAAAALRRRELLRVACADLLGRLDVGRASGRALHRRRRGHPARPALDVALRACAARAGHRRSPTCPSDLAVIGMGRLGGARAGLRLRRRRAVRLRPATGADEAQGQRRPRNAVADDAAPAARRARARPARSRSTPTCGRRAGRAPLVAQPLARYAEYYAALVVGLGGAGAAARRCRSPATSELGARVRRADRPDALPGRRADPPSRSPRSAGSRPGSSSERLPRGADPATHTKLGRGGLADVEWTVQLLQLRHAADAAGAAGHAAPSTRWRAPGDAGLLDAEQRRGAAGGVGPGHPGPQRDVPGPRPARRPAAPARAGAGRRRPGLRLGADATRASSSTTTGGPPGTPARSWSRSSTAGPAG